MGEVGCLLKYYCQYDYYDYDDDDDDDDDDGDDDNDDDDNDDDDYYYYLLNFLEPSFPVLSCLKHLHFSQSDFKKETELF